MNLALFKSGGLTVTFTMFENINLSLTLYRLFDPGWHLFPDFCMFRGDYYSPFPTLLFGYLF